MNRSRQVKGRAKEVTGEATGNRKLEWSGKKDMALGEVKELGNREGAAATQVWASPTATSPWPVTSPPSGGTMISLEHRLDRIAVERGDRHGVR